MNRRAFQSLVPVAIISAFFAIASVSGNHQNRYYNAEDPCELKAIDHGGFFERIDGKSRYQNSPRAFLESANAGITFHNLDICFSSDGIPFVSHDDELTDINGDTFSIAQTSLKDIKRRCVGDQFYSWTLLTLEECCSFINQTGGTVEMVDVSTATEKDAVSLPQYYRDHDLSPTWTNFDEETLRNRFIENGPEFGVYLVINKKGAMEDAVRYLQSWPKKEFCLNIKATGAKGKIREEAESFLPTLEKMNTTLYVYLYGEDNKSDIPAWADGALSETINVNR